MDILYAAAILARAVLLQVAEYQDAQGTVKYTDIDYEVYTDAARFVVDGGSPYQRSTYRYTPLLAWLLTPNIHWHRSWGKFVFCACDILAAWLIGAILRSQGISRRMTRLSQGLWLFSPLTVSMSTRGSCESVVAALLLGMLRCLQLRQNSLAAVLYGSAIHWRIYPIVYALPLAVWLSVDQAWRRDGVASLKTAAKSRSRQSQAQEASAGMWHRQLSLLRLRLNPLSLMRRAVSRASLWFGFVAGATLIAATAATYVLYGYEAIDAAYLYHARRSDPRHNFAPHFLAVYAAPPEVSMALPLIGHPTVFLGRMTAAVQLFLLVLSGPLGAGNLTLALLLQTMIFVAFNKVCTSQYFVWYFTFAPLLLPHICASAKRWRLVYALAFWVAGQALWLATAYLLEFKGRAVHVPLWGASLAFFALHVDLIVAVLQASV